ncbi:DMT family transporter [Actinoallomurus iriomotensis]|uniref:Multidrug transporter n=1 Tax=Actinoallomurus iriomotensis TaxID=478107 RepID=A0A9W6RSF3_9ACTN|nr:DMT family transporter [Actinoallomurus iriomotensis]GLY79075.1 multidrug transporter [Actinoallomurus iriomotensis]
MGALLALASAVCYGLSDFAGGLLSRRAGFVAVALAGQLGGLVLALAAAPAFPVTAVPVSDLGWGALSGVGTGLGMLFLFRGLSRGAMSVVVPVSAVSGVALPAVVGVALLGDHPSALSWLGIAVAVPALWLVSRGEGAGGRRTGASAFDGLLAGTGIALQYVALAQAAPRAGVWPVVTGRLAAALTILPLLVTAGAAARRAGGRQVLLAAGTGAMAATALMFYLAATREELLVVAVVLSSFYPAIPVLLGITALRERLSALQTAGLLGAAAAIGLLTLG